MPFSMWLLFAGSFQKQLTAVFGYDSDTAKGIAKNAKPKYKAIISDLPEFEKADRFKMNIVNCAMLGAFILSMPERPDVERLAEYYANAMMTKPMKWFCHKSGKSKFTEKDIAGNIYFYKATNDTDPDVSQEVIITNVQIEEAAAATEYEPYHAPVTTTISLPAPLTAEDYISYTAQAIIHADDTKTSVSLPKIPTYKGTTILECNTENAPASAEITYYTNEEE